ncbi:MAG: M48 family metallopeptidase [Cyanobacteria bacterium J06633_8]
MSATPLQSKTQDSAKWKDSQELKDAVSKWEEQINVKVKKISLRGMKRKWASISTTGNLTLNTELLELPKELGEFVIVHELVHLLVPNHGKVFKCFMSIYLPDWEERERKLQSCVG